MNLVEEMEKRRSTAYMFASTFLVLCSLAVVIGILWAFVALCSLGNFHKADTKQMLKLAEKNFRYNQK